MLQLIAQATTTANDAAPGASAMLIVPITMGAFILVMLGLAIGLFFGRRPISGSCGGIGNVTGEDGETSCSLCQNPAEACKELQKRAGAQS